MSIPRSADESNRTWPPVNDATAGRVYLPASWHQQAVPFHQRKSASVDSVLEWAPRVCSVAEVALFLLRITGRLA